MDKDHESDGRQMNQSNEIAFFFKGNFNGNKKPFTNLCLSLRHQILFRQKTLFFFFFSFLKDDFFCFSPSLRESTTFRINLQDKKMNKCLNGFKAKKHESFLKEMKNKFFQSFIKTLIMLSTEIILTDFV